MAKRDQFEMSIDERRIRRFSESFKTAKVREIEQGKTKISDICKQYEVSNTNVYRWISKYGKMKTKKIRTIVESESDTQQLLALKKKVAELERIIGQKQILLDFKDKMIDIAEEMYGVDIKKKLTTPQLNTTGKTENDSSLA
jgi:transposase-like protein